MEKSAYRRPHIGQLKIEMLIKCWTNAGWMNEEQVGYTELLAETGETEERNPESNSVSHQLLEIY